MKPKNTKIPHLLIRTFKFLGISIKCLKTIDIIRAMELNVYLIKCEIWHCLTDSHIVFLWLGFQEA